MNDKKSSSRISYRILWAPWRVEYITSAKRGGCLFCAKTRARDLEKAGVLFRGDKAFILLNAYPYNSGHLMVAPYRHVADLEKLESKETVEILELVQRSVAAIKTVLRPQGFNVGFNLGRPAGAGIVNHLHVHVVPRWSGDTNFMPVLSRTRVISQSLREAYRLLRKTIE